MAIRSAFVLVLTVLMWFAMPDPTAAATLTFVVNKPGDAADLHPGDGKCDSSTTTGKQCTLRAAIQEANAVGSASVIHFNLPSTTTKITPLSALPAITAAGLVIDGYTQPGAAANSLAVGDNAVVKVVIDGIKILTAADGLQVNATNVVIKGLDIQRFTGNGITVSGTGTQIQGNLVGINVAGTGSRANKNGVDVTGGGSDAIGGTAPAARNVISGNTQEGILVSSSGGTDIPSLVIAGNYIGTTKGGMAALGNGFVGVEVFDASNSTIGPGNVVSGNGRSGIAVSGKSGYQIIGNIVGPKADRTGALGNTDGIDVQVATNSVVGGAGSNGNLISGNTSDGVLLFQGANSIEVTGNTIRSNANGIDIVASSSDTIHGNSIISNSASGIEVSGSSHVGNSTGDRFYGNTTIANGGLGINLNGGTEDSFGVTANDAGDVDAGPNGLQNYPVITSAVSNSKSGLTVISGTLNSMANQLFTIDVYLAVVDPSGHGEGETTFGSKDVTTGSNSSVSWQLTIARVPPGTVLTSTATQLDGDGTSEFSANTVVTGT